MFDFPNSPTIDQLYEPVGGPKYRWNGYGWAKEVTLSNNLNEAPTDGQLYERRGSTASWVVATSGGGAGVTDGDKGDIVVSGSGATWMLDSTVVTPVAKTVLDDTTTAAMLTTLGAYSTTGGTISGSVTITQQLQVNGYIRATGGLLATPAYSFFADTNTGLVLEDLDKLGFVTGGALRVTISNTALESSIPVVLPAAPTTDLQAATKKYVDDGLAVKAKLATISTAPPSGGTDGDVWYQVPP